MHNEQKDFGFTKVSGAQKRSLVDSVFSNVASKYDLMNDLMSAGIHRLWKDEFCKMIPDLNASILDVAGGTGDISFRLKKLAKKQAASLNITISDINKEMLMIGRERAIDQNILTGLNFALADAQKLPFADNSFDYYTIAFGIRNVINIDEALSEARRVLKPGGKFLCLEFSKVKNDMLKSIYDFYSFNLIPAIGEFVTDNKEAYKYLAESISLFPTQIEFKKMIQKSGFTNVGFKDLTFGVVAIHYGYK